MLIHYMSYSHTQTVTPVSDSDTPGFQWDLTHVAIIASITVVRLPA